jgi:hypothetical protein
MKNLIRSTDYQRVTHTSTLGQSHNLKVVLIAITMCSYVSTVVIVRYSGGCNGGYTTELIR